MSKLPADYAVLVLIMAGLAVPFAAWYLLFGTRPKS
jgi:hypothetical protein